MKCLDLTTLQSGLPAITPAYGSSLAEAAAVCLDDQGHSSGSILEVIGENNASYQLTWPVVTDQMLRCWNDREYATEQAAYAIAFLLIQETIGFTVVRRSRRGTGYDYLLGNALAPIQGDNYLANLARLEVSGIRSGTISQIKSRVKLKLEQVRPTDGSLPAYIVVVEFSHPFAQIAYKVSSSQK
jgi:hypothetical protein